MRRTLAIRALLTTATLLQALPASPRDNAAAIAGPASALAQLRDAYNGRDIDLFARTLTADYRFHSSAAAMHDMTSGIDRDNELKTTRNFFYGSSGGARSTGLHAIEISVSVGHLSVEDDPEHPDSTRHYRLIGAAGWGMQAKASRGASLTTPPARHVFHVVRGDAALLVPGQAADSSVWYIRRWFEDVDALANALAGAQGACGEERISERAVAAAPAGIAIRALKNPACPRMELTLEVSDTSPVDLRVYDVSGRVVQRKTVVVDAPGAVRIEAGEGTGFSPGVYWVQATQPGQKPSTRMVVVAR